MIRFMNEDSKSLYGEFFHKDSKSLYSIKHCPYTLNNYKLYR